jgi:hypothetical protein
MTLSEWTGIVGVVLAVLSLAYALWEKRSRARLSDFIRAQNWSLYGKASNSIGHAQTALAKYKALGKDKLDPDVLEFLSKADAFGQDVFKDVIRQIQFSEPVFDDETVSRWVREGRVAEKYALLFRQLTRANKPIQPTPQSGAADG